jgi:hypothetical protein
MKTTCYLLAERRVSARALVREYPAAPAHPNKKLLFSLCESQEPSGDISVSRWRTDELPSVIPTQKRPRITHTREPFQYEAASADERAWHLNFANADLFCSYGGPFFAQDEIQVAEHPVLASLRSWLLALQDETFKPITREATTATPILIQGVERRCQIDPSEIYGARFGRASAEQLKAAVRLLRPVTYSNIIAMEAPVGGQGAYSSGVLSRIIQTAYCGFSAAKQRSEGKQTMILTGHWGTGAYGGNKIVMSALQLLAAHLAEVEHIRYHTLDAQEEFIEGLQLYEHLLRQSWWARLRGKGSPRSLQDALREVESMRFRWGDSDGN